MTIYLTIFVIVECIFVGYKWNKKEVDKPSLLQLVALLFVEGHKIEYQENLKDKFDIGLVLWVTHIYKQSRHLKHHWSYIEEL